MFVLSLGLDPSTIGVTLSFIIFLKFWFSLFYQSVFFFWINQFINSCDGQNKIINNFKLEYKKFEKETNISAKKVKRVHYIQLIVVLIPKSLMENLYLVGNGKQMAEMEAHGLRPKSW